jgi:2-desacetyl-2-hydroxyethyl bacteriochlorophyllide A dehydrogenase
MLAAVYKGDKQFDLTEYPVRNLNEGEVLVKVNSCGICGTDHHILAGKTYANVPVILGHEYSGTVVDKAEGIERVALGDKVVIDPNIYCGKCKYCRKGMINFCENHQALGVTINGGFAEYSHVPVSQIYRLPTDFNLSEAAFAEPLSCCLRGIQQAEIKVGDSVVIIGGGSIGLIMIQLARMSGASKVILIEPLLHKREIAFKLGADLTLDPNEIDSIDKLIDYTNGGAEVAIECVGMNKTVEMSLDLVDRGGTVVIFGLAPVVAEAKLNLQKMFQKEIRIHNSFLNPYTFETAVNLLTTRKINVSDLLTHQTPLENIKELFYSNDLSGNIKIQVTNLNKEE